MSLACLAGHTLKNSSTLMAKFKSPSFWERKIGLVNLQKPAIVKSGTSITESVRLMQKMKIGCVLRSCGRQKRRHYWHRYGR